MDREGRMYSYKIKRRPLRNPRVKLKVPLDNYQHIYGVLACRHLNSLISTTPNKDPLVFDLSLEDFELVRKTLESYGKRKQLRKAEVYVPTPSYKTAVLRPSLKLPRKKAKRSLPAMPEERIPPQLVNLPTKEEIINALKTLTALQKRGYDLENVEEIRFDWEGRRARGGHFSRYITEPRMYEMVRHLIGLAESYRMQIGKPELRIYSTYWWMNEDAAKTIKELRLQLPHYLEKMKRVVAESVPA